VSGGFHVDTEVLRRHGSRVDQVAADVHSARSAAGATDLHGGAFGLLCSFLPATVGGVDGAAREAIAAVHQGARDAVDGLGGMARDFDAVDERVQEVLRGLVKVLDR